MFRLKPVPVLSGWVSEVSEFVRSTRSCNSLGASINGESVKFCGFAVIFDDAVNEVLF
jgi:hypothetical protein